MNVKLHIIATQADVEDGRSIETFRDADLAELRVDALSEQVGLRVRHLVMDVEDILLDPIHAETLQGMLELAFDIFIDGEAREGLAVLFDSKEA